MIEIEKNFDLRHGDKEKIISEAKFLGSREIKDVYYDSSDFVLTCRDYWLRERNGKWELKVPIVDVKTDDYAIDRYTELESDEEIIIRELKLDKNKKIKDSLNALNIFPFSTIVTKRETYQKGEYHLDFDEMDFGFVTFELEIMVKDKKDIPSAEKKIANFVKRFGIDPTKGRGKVIEYLFRKNKKHYNALVSAGVIRK
jgi:adenylate cyclase class IV